MRDNDDKYRKLLNSARWRATRAAQLGRQPFCEDCAKEGVLTEATEVHHVVPVKSIKDPERMLVRMFDCTNLASLCHACHVERHRRLGKNTKEENLNRAREEAAQFCRRFFGDPGADFSPGEGVS